MSKDESLNVLKWLWLSFTHKISKGKIHKLLDAFGNIDNIYDSSGEDYEKLSFLKSEDILKLCDKSLADAQNFLGSLSKTDIFVLTKDMPDFPNMLNTYPNHPCVLYCRGKRINLNKYISVSVVGSRNPGQYGKNVTYALSSQLSKKGFIIISGMADGIDSIAHEACLDSGIPTVAVLGCGPDIIYPASNINLSKRILENGMIISEYIPKTKPDRFRFPERNKIIASLSPATVVTEAAEKSGSLITAEHAKKFGNVVFAVPGNITSSLSNGTNLLIRDGAIALSSSEDIYKFFSKVLSEVKLKKYLYKNCLQESYQKNPYEESKKIDIKEINDKYNSYSDDEKENIIMKCLCKESLTIDMLSYKTGISISDLNTLLLLMELKGMIKKAPGDSFAAV